MSVTSDLQPLRLPDPSAVLTLLKPITWFPPMWAYVCGAISAGASPAGQWPLVALGVVLAGPVVCGMSQAANDWCDRHVDAINEPDRPIPSGRIPGRWGLWIALAMSALAVVMAIPLGPWGLGATLVAVAAAWAYSAEPVRLKRSGWLGPGLVGLSYETLPWITGAAVLSAGAPATEVLMIATALWSRRTRDHDTERLQGAGRRPPDRRRLPAGPRWVPNAPPAWPAASCWRRRSL